MSHSDTESNNTISATGSETDNANNQQAPAMFGKSESHAMGFADRMKDLFSGKKIVSTVMALGFIFTWSERVLTTFNTGFSLYRDVPKMVKNGNLQPLKTGARNVANLAIPGSDNNFISKFSTGDRLQAIGTVLGLSQNLWFFTSSRSGDIPDGNTMLERAKSILTHPQHHAAQITTLWTATALLSISIGRLMMGYTSLSHDAAGNQIGLNPRKALNGLDGFQKLDKLTPLITGAVALLAGPLAVYGQLNIKKPKAQNAAGEEEEKNRLASDNAGTITVPDDSEKPAVKAFAKSSSEAQIADKTNGFKDMIAMFAPGNIKEMLQYAVHKDPTGLTGRTLSLGVDIGFFGVGLAKLKQIESGLHAHKYGAIGSPQWQTARANALQSRNVGILGFALTVLYSMYVYDTLLHAHKKEQEKLKAESDGKEMAR